MDDNATEAEALKRLLKLRFDADVFVATNRKDATEVIRENNLDCIALDLELRDSQIEDTINWIPRIPYPVFAYTGFDDPGLRERVLDAGAEDFIQKASGDAGIVERIAHLQYKHKPDRKLLQGAFAARQQDKKSKGSWMNMATGVAAVLTFLGGLLLGAYGFAVTQGKEDERARQHFERLDNAVVQLTDAGRKRDQILDDLRDKATRSMDDRAAIREAQRESNAMMIDWLKRIEGKLDARK